jgi:hypothetical protein
MNNGHGALLTGKSHPVGVFGQSRINVSQGLIE